MSLLRRRDQELRRPSMDAGIGISLFKAMRRVAVINTLEDLEDELDQMCPDGVLSDSRS